MNNKYRFELSDAEANKQFNVTQKNIPMGHFYKTLLLLA